MQFERLEFTFLGSDKQFIFFIQQLKNHIPQIDLDVKSKRVCAFGYEYVISIQNDSNIAFMAGHVQAATYAKFGRFENTEFRN